ncbi:AMP-binding protein [Salibacterium aidingense]|uniref:AMP-binding protein n=1 Tax=Salibacterium aidingense TaxID=384933 RepID=UPI000413E125|nr:AMP-binding protein [Salibacterium aidingense]
MSIADAVRKHAETQPDKTALVTSEQGLTYKELEIKTNRAAEMFHETAVFLKETPPPIAAILLPNGTAFLEIVLGAAKAGWIAATLDPKWSRKEITTVIQNIKPALLFTDESYISCFHEWRGMVKIIVIGGKATGFEAYEQWLSSRENTFPVAMDVKECPFYMGFTSGTTGLPKGFIRTQQSWMISFAEGDKELGLHPEDNISVPGPLVHSLFLFAALHALHLGAVCFLEEKFFVRSLLSRWKKDRITVMYGVPSMYEAVINTAEHTDWQQAVMRKCIISGDKWSQNRKDFLKTVLPETEWISFYGSSELSFVSVFSDRHPGNRPYGLGYPFSTVETSIRDSRGKEVTPGEKGELFVRSPMTFSGYAGGEAVLPEQWIPSGDIVWEEADGFLNLAGRKKNQIVTGGLNVFPEEVEQLLKSHPRIKDAAVIGVKDHYWGEITSAFIVPAAEQNGLVKELKNYCKTYLSAYKCPKIWKQVNDLPLTTSGKPSRQKLTNMLPRERQEGYES